MYISTAQQMKETDRRAIEDYNLNSLVLMEHAAISSVLTIKKRFSNGKCVILCGKGNNGGDGFAIARLLFCEGFDVACAYFSDVQSFSPDCAANYNLIKKYGIKEITDMYDFKNEVEISDFTVDCLFGFGFSKTLIQNNLEAINILNEYSKYIYSIDIPSGVSADFGLVQNAVCANETITFTSYKKSAFLFPSAEYYGKITLVDIGIDKKLISYDAKVTEKPIIEKRKKHINKSDAGKILIVAGSKGMSGAAYLCSSAALKSGAGLVTLAHPKCLATVLEQKTTEVMTLEFDDCNGSFSAAEKDKICEIINNYDAVVFGPGISRTNDICEILKNILNKCRVPLIIDADGLFALKNCLEHLKYAMCEIIITPHSMEMARLIGESAEYVENNRFEVCKRFSEEYAVCTVLKGAYTIVCDKNGETAVNYGTANPGMATAGSGDVLAGICSSFCANFKSTFEAAKNAVYMHGLAGDIAEEKNGEYSMTALDILENISAAFKNI